MLYEVITFELAKKIKQSNPQSLICVGGYLATSAPEEILSVITSYSIHYTKLYDLNVVYEPLSVSLKMFAAYGGKKNITMIIGLYSKLITNNDKHFVLKGKKTN